MKNNRGFRFSSLPEEEQKFVLSKINAIDPESFNKELKDKDPISIEEKKKPSLPLKFLIGILICLLFIVLYDDFSKRLIFVIILSILLMKLFRR